MTSFIKRAIVAGQTGPTGGGFTDAKFVKSWPALYEYMTSRVGPDGEAREVSTLKLFAQDGELKAMLKDDGQGVVLFATGRGLDGVLNALEGLLTAPETPWRVDSYARDRKTKGGQGKR